MIESLEQNLNVIPTIKINRHLFQMLSYSRFKEYISFKPLIGLGFF